MCKVKKEWRLKDLEHANQCPACCGYGKECCGCGGDPSERCEACKGSGECDCHYCHGEDGDIRLSDNDSLKGIELVAQLAEQCEQAAGATSVNEPQLESLQDQICDLYGLPRVDWLASHGYQPTGLIGAYEDKDIEAWLSWFQGRLIARFERLDDVDQRQSELVAEAIAVATAHAEMPVGLDLLA